MSERHSIHSANGTSVPVLKPRSSRKKPPREGKPQGWSGRNSDAQREEKQAMADYFVHHDFLVGESVTSKKLSSATILVNPGTTQQSIVSGALDWMITNKHEADLTWYTPGTVIPTILKDKRDNHPYLLAATQLFMFPGRLDIQIDSLSSPETADFVAAYERAFTYVLLSARSLDLRTGKVNFHFSSEIPLQHAIAVKQAKHKFLFLDSSKFDSISEGGIGYSIEELLMTSQLVTLYTVSSSTANDQWIIDGFERLGRQLLVSQPGSKDRQPDMKQLRLRIIGAKGSRTEIRQIEGQLKCSPPVSPVGKVEKPQLTAVGA